MNPETRRCWYRSKDRTADDYARNPYHMQNSRHEDEVQQGETGTISHRLLSLGKTNSISAEIVDGVVLAEEDVAC